MQVGDTDLPTRDGNTFRNLSRFKALVNRMEDVEELKLLFAPFTNSVLATMANDEVSLAENESVRNLRRMVDSLPSSISALREALRPHVPTQTDTTVCIQLPDPPDFATALTDLQNIRIAFEQVIVNPGVSGSLKLTSWEMGSFLLYLSVGTLSAVTVIGKIVWSAALIRKQLLENERVKQQLRATDLQLNTMEEVSASLKRHLATLLHAEALAIYDSHFGSDKTPEQLERLKYSIQVLADILQRGGTITPALNAPPNIQEVFPDPQNLLSIVSKIKSLEDSSSA